MKEKNEIIIKGGKKENDDWDGKLYIEIYGTRTFLMSASFRLQNCVTKLINEDEDDD